MNTIPPRPPFAAPGGGPLIIAHRGGSLEAPENTLASLAHGIAAGSDWQELDVQLSHDGRLVVLHDERLERTTSGRGLAQAQAQAQLLRLSAGAPGLAPEVRQVLDALQVEAPDFGNRYAGERVPSLDQALALAGSRLLIEMKPNGRPSLMASQVIAAVGRARAYDRVALGSFQFEALAAAYALAPALPLVGIAEDSVALERLLELPLAVLAVDKPMLAEALRAAPPGVAVWVWTSYAVAEGRGLAAAGAHGIISDAPAALLRALRPGMRASAGG